MSDILIVDDEETLLATLSLELRRTGHTIAAAQSAEQALELLELREPQVALVDIRLPEMDGVQLISRIRAAGHDFPIVVMTAYGSVEGAVAAMKVGADDYLQKPVGIAELELVIERVLRNSRLIDRLDAFERERERQGAERTLIARSEAMKRAMAMASRIASVPPDDDGSLPAVLITGETGAGKDVLAHHMHDLSGRREAPFVQINCSALPASLVETELFGSERGATGALAGKKGLFEAAGEGTVFLDEIGDMPVSLQAKLLLVLERRSFRRAGEDRDRRVKARLLAATNCDLSQLAAEGRFRKDLLFRLQALSIDVPPLRSRPDDLVPLAEHFIDRQSRRLHRAAPKLSAEAIAVMRRYAWPGNVRELDNVMQRAVLLCDERVIRAEGLNLSQGALAPQPMSLSALRLPFGCEGFTLADVEDLAIQQALEHCRGNVSEAARILGVSRGALRHRLDRRSEPAE